MKRAPTQADAAKRARDARRAQLAAAFLKGEAGFGEVVKAIALDHDITQSEARAIVQSFFRRAGVVVQRTGRFLVPGAGVFLARTRKARRIANPITHDLMKLPASRTVGFRPTKESVFR